MQADRGKPAIERFTTRRYPTASRRNFSRPNVGDHYSAHRDGRSSHVVGGLGNAEDANGLIGPLMGALQRRDHYGGGALSFFGLFDHPSGEAIGIALEAAEGLLMTFPADMLHAVAPVTNGERYTIATWFCA